MSARKKWIIAGSVIVGLILLMLLLSFTLFSLKTVKIDFRTSTSVLTGQEKKIISDGKFDIGKPVLFYSKKSAIRNMEKANPYLKVINIETIFPNTFIVHCKEREEVYAYVHEGQTYYLDEELKILRQSEDEFLSTSENSILLNSNHTGTLEVGKKANFENFSDIYSAFIENNRTLFEIKALVKELKISTHYDDNEKASSVMCSLELFNGQTYNFYHADRYAKYKIALFYSVFSQIYSLIGKSKPDGSIWTREELDTAIVEIDNYYIVEDVSNSVYFRVIPRESLTNN